MSDCFNHSCDALERAFNGEILNHKEEHEK